jgi:hypothetical protein
VAVLSEARHGWAVTGHVAVANELATHGAPQGGVVCEKAGVVDSPHEFLLVGELDVGEYCVFFVESEVGAVLRGAGEEGTVFGCLREGCVCVCVFGDVAVSVNFEVGVSVGCGFPLGLWNKGVWPSLAAYRHV